MDQARYVGGAKVWQFETASAIFYNSEFTRSNTKWDNDGMLKEFFRWFREHALRDAAKEAAKWLWAAGGSAVTLAAQATLGFFRGHQDLTALVISGGCFLLLLIVSVVMHRRPRSFRNDALQSAPPTETKEEIENLKSQIAELCGGPHFLDTKKAFA